MQSIILNKVRATRKGVKSKPQNGFMVLELGLVLLIVALACSLQTGRPDSPAESAAGDNALILSSVPDTTGTDRRQASFLPTDQYNYANDQYHRQ